MGKNKFEGVLDVKKPCEKALIPAIALGWLALWSWMSWISSAFKPYAVSIVSGAVALAWLVGVFVQPRRRWLVQGLAVAVAGVLVAVPVAVEYQATRHGDVVHARFASAWIAMLPDGADQLRLASAHRMVGVNPGGSAAWTWIGVDLTHVWSLGDDLLLVSQFNTRLSVVGVNDGVTRWTIDPDPSVSDPIVLAASDGVIVVGTGQHPEMLTGLSAADGHQMWQMVGKPVFNRVLSPSGNSSIGVNDVLATHFTTTLSDGSEQVHDAATGEATAVYPADVKVLLVGDSVFTLTQHEDDCVMEQADARTPRTGNVDPVLCSRDSLVLRLAGDCLIAERVGQILDLEALTSRPLRKSEVLGSPAQSTTITQDSERLTFRDLGSGEELWSIDAPPAYSRVILQGDRLLVATVDDCLGGRFFSAKHRDHLKVYDARTGDLLASVRASRIATLRATDGWLLYQAPDEDNYRMLPLAK